MSACDSETIGYEQLIASLDHLDVEQLAGVVDRASSLLKKVIVKGIPSKKKGTGVVPPQLEQNHEWVKYVLGDAQLNGWESFEMRSKKTDKETGGKHEEVVVMRESEEKEGVHVFADTGKEFTQKDAMSYSKLLKDRNDDLYKAFMEDYSSMTGPKKEATTKVVVKKTSEELEREKEEKAAAKEREKEEKKAVKAREKAEKEAEKAREKAEKEAEKAREKAEKEAEKEAEKMPQKKMVLVPVKRDRSSSPAPAAAAAAAPTAAAVAAPTAAATAAAAVSTPQKKMVVKKPTAPVKAARPEADPFVPGKDGGLVKWSWNEKEYLRDGDKYVWLYDETEEEAGAFQGRYNYKLDAIEDCEEPTYGDEDNESDEEVDLGL